MYRGGYIIIDLIDTALTTGGDPVIVKGVYSAIEANYCRPTLFENINLDAAQRNNCYVNLKAGSGAFKGVLEIEINSDGALDVYTITIDDDDKVSVAKTTITSAS